MSGDQVGTQTLTWTALPKSGERGAKTGARTYAPGTVTLSVHLSPALEPVASGTPATLGAFADFGCSAATNVEWPRRLMQLKFRVEVTNKEEQGAGRQRSKEVSPRLGYVEPQAWAGLFDPATPVRSFSEHAPIAPARVLSYRAKSVSEMIDKTYGGVARQPSMVVTQPTVERMFKIGSTLGTIAATGFETRVVASTLPVVPIVVDPGSVTDFRRTVKPSSVLARFNDFHEPFVDTNLSAPSLPELEFHTVISSLSNYPWMLRKLGLVFEVDVPETLVKNMKMIRVVPVWPEGVEQTEGHGAGVRSVDKSPWTRFTLNWNRTYASPFLPAPRKSKPQIRDGEMILGSSSSTGASPVSVLGYDLDAAMMGLKSLSENVLVNMDETASAAARGVRASADPVTGSVFAPRDTTTGLPAIRTIGPSLFLNDAEQSFKDVLTRTESLKEARNNAGDGRAIVLDAEDVTQGWRVDVWDDTTAVWHSLCTRLGEYRLGERQLTWKGGATELVDEGWIEQAAVTKYKNEGENLGDVPVKVSAQMFEWDGWSLVVAKPGRPVLDGPGAGLPDEDGTVTDSLGTYTPGEYVHSRFPLSARFRVPDGTLPLLRFGTAYRYRVRAVDIAGNSNPFREHDTKYNRLGVTKSVVHRRYEPIPPPVCLPKTALGAGESDCEIVLRSLDGAMAPPSERHIIPPQCPVKLAEQHGGFDVRFKRNVDGVAKWFSKPDPAAYDLIRHREHSLPDSSPSPIAEVPYLPEVTAKGASLRGLPGTPRVAAGRDVKDGESLVFSGAQVGIGSAASTFTVTRVSWGSETWYDAKPFVLRVVGCEATDARLTAHAAPARPTWDVGARTLSIELPKAERVTVDLASDIGKVVKSDWMALQYVGVSGATSAGGSGLTGLLRQLKRATDVGANWMTTPPQQLVMTHAVQKPLMAPNATFSAFREANATWATPLPDEGMPIHGKSTGRIDVIGRWTEYVDDPASDPADPTAMPTFARPVEPQLAFNLDVQYEDTRLTWNAEKARHEFGDTKHRVVSYQTKATSRYRDRFGAGVTDFTLTGNPDDCDIPASARPQPPSVAYCVPSFKHVNEEDSRERLAGIRVYLNRPWFSSGEGERLGVVFLEPASSLYGEPGNYADFLKVRPWVSEWGHDPIWVGKTLPNDYLRASSFDGATVETNVRLAEELRVAGVSVAHYEVEFDPVAKLWFADVRLNSGDAYWPFVRLAVCRWQPSAIGQLNNSTTAMCEFIQRVPDRRVEVSYGSGGGDVTVSVSGPTYTAGSADSENPNATPRPSTRWVAVAVQRRLGTGDFGWEKIYGWVQLTTPQPWLPAYPTGMVRATFPLPTRTPGYEYRVQVREHENFSADEGSTDIAERLVFVETVPLWGGRTL